MIKDILLNRQVTHGEFRENANLTIEMEFIATQSTNWKHLSDAQTVALRMIFQKISRALSGDHTEIDHWKDIAGYAELIVKELEKTKNENTVRPLEQIAQEIIQQGKVDVKV